MRIHLNKGICHCWSAFKSEAVAVGIINTDKPGSAATACSCRITKDGTGVEGGCMYALYMYHSAGNAVHA